jgi:hypothetical protein
MPHSKINIWICLGLALLVCIYPSYSQAPGVRPRPAKPAGKSFGKESEFLSPDKKWMAPGLEHLSPNKKWMAPGLTKERAPPKPYGETRRKLIERYKNDPEFRKKVDQRKAQVIEDGIDKAILSYLPKHSMLDEYSSVQFVANQSDKDIDEARLGDDMKKIATKVLYNAVRNVPLFEFQTESDCTSALKDAVKKACDELNRVEESLPWTLKFELESDDLVFQSRDDKHPDAKLPIKAILSDLANLKNYDDPDDADDLEL